MTDRSHDTKSALLDEPEAHRQPEEVIFPAIERTPTAKELEAMVSSAVPEAAAASAEQQPDAETEKPISGKRKMILLLAGSVIVAIGISIYFYLQNRPKPIPTP